MQIPERRVAARDVESWLAGRVVSGSLWAVVSALVAFLSGVFVCLITYWLIYFIILMSVHWCLPHTHRTRLIAAGMVMLLLFVANVLADRSRLGRHSFSTGTVTNVIVQGVNGRSNINPLAPDSASSFVKILSLTVLAGPQLLTLAVGACRRVLRLRGMNVPACSSALAALASEPRGLDASDLASAAVGAEELMRSLDALRGVVLVGGERPRLILTDELRRELRGL